MDEQWIVEFEINFDGAAACENLRADHDVHKGLDLSKE
jgi:hypothetical protein